MNGALLLTLEDATRQRRFLQSISTKAMDPKPFPIVYTYLFTFCYRFNFFAHPNSTLQIACLVAVLEKLRVRFVSNASEIIAESRYWANFVRVDDKASIRKAIRVIAVLIFVAIHSDVSVIIDDFFVWSELPWCEQAVGWIRGVAWVCYFLLDTIFPSVRFRVFDGWFRFQRRTDVV